MSLLSTKVVARPLRLPCASRPSKIIPYIKDAQKTPTPLAWYASHTLVQRSQDTAMGVALVVRFKRRTVWSLTYPHTRIALPGSLRRSGEPLFREACSKVQLTRVQWIRSMAGGTCQSCELLSSFLPRHKYFLPRQRYHVAIVNCHRQVSVTVSGGQTVAV